ncbi:hypothetical protein NAF17_04460 [Mucilaginibacter sp. RB4R14]|uniref:hypothetical protein n=1 Tax=Mucilaginibacter aurantiaciroseus TaxID=2949308 RepID=UPI002091C0F6|nr:hypothetical protein [Mucilaginibacter aurantiaciroseus]MCO5934783.1 hypothetical protein [Mucilaginibacter aurantiaciroseus]
MRKAFYILGLLALVSSSLFAQQKVEKLTFPLPAEYKFKVGSDQENAQTHFIEMIPQNETFDNWSIIFSSTLAKGVKGLGMDKAVDYMYTTAKNTAIDPKLTIIEKNESGHWALFTIETAKYKVSPKPESQLFYVIEGSSGLFINSIALKQKKIPCRICNEMERDI